MGLWGIRRGKDKNIINKVTDFVAPTLSKALDYLPMPHLSLTNEDLEGHRNAQRLAYQAVTEISSEMNTQISEKRVSQLMDTYLQDYGVKSFFHRSFAWFGERTCFYNFKDYWDFIPTDRPLNENEVVILDVAPIVNGYTADIGYTFSLQPNVQLEKMNSFLLELRTEIPKMFSSQMKLGEIYQKVDELILSNHYDNVHAFYPGEVLGHRVHKNPFSNFRGVSRPFSLQAYFDLFSRGLFPELLGPYHEGNKEGLWAIEPHIGNKEFGAKFEEILVVEKERAYWLDDQVPHLQGPDQKLEKS